MCEDEKSHKKKTDTGNETLVNNVLGTVKYLDNITNLDLSNGNISNISEDIELPPNIIHLNISNNKLTEVPDKVLNLNYLRTLDLSFNCIVFFDDTPSFCHSIETLNISNNKLEGPPYWVWAEKPKKLRYLNLSNNNNICMNFKNGYFEEVVKYTTLVYEIDVHNCNLSKHVKLMATFCNAKVISLGNGHYDHLNVNHLDHVPCEGLDKCCDVERLNLTNTHLYCINSNIDIYHNLKELNLAENSIHSLPNEFSNLENLETCILSFNKLLYLPDNMNKLVKLVKLYLDHNELCMLPDTLNEIHSLKSLDLYNNNLSEALDSINNLDEVDMAQNYLEEPKNEEYLVKKEKLRVNMTDRINGRKTEVVKDESEYSKCTESDDDDELYTLISKGSDDVKHEELPKSRCSSPEDWDSDDYWIPQYYKPITPPRSPWLYFVKKKIEEGNFCPIDAHPISIVELVKYEKMCNPPIEHESDGQFDDYSDDDS